jgi:5-methylcytosine-specific restriction endonuclease McrA
VIRKLCAHPGCGRLAEPRTNRCALHPKRRVSRHRRYRELAHSIIANASLCGICGRPLHGDPLDPPVVDHIIPRAYGGDDDPTNLQPTHRSCNSRKSSQLPST